MSLRLPPCDHDECPPSHCVEPGTSPREGAPDEPKICRAKMGERPEWMSPGQYDPCFCRLQKGHGGPHACEHENAHLLGTPDAIDLLQARHETLHTEGPARVADSVRVKAESRAGAGDLTPDAEPGEADEARAVCEKIRAHYEHGDYELAESLLRTREAAAREAGWDAAFKAALDEFSWRRNGGQDVPPYVFNALRSLQLAARRPGGGAR